MTEIPKPIQGRKPGDRRVRVDRPYAPYFRYAGPGQLVAKEAASRPTTGLGLRIAGLRRALFGRPLSTYEEIGERLSKKKALAIFSSDAISSSAYATEEILLVLLAAGGAALYLSVEVSIAIAIMLAVVTTSYRQIGYAYPNGGGAYAVSRANLGKLPALVAAAALLVDYILTVAVSISSAVAQIVSVDPDLFPFTVVLCVLFVALMTLGNLRGIRESGNIFAVPTYLFVGAALLMIGLGLWQVLVLGQGAPYPELVERGAPLEAVTILLLLRAFAAGSVALTGTEAIANGVPAFQPPEPRNAAVTLSVMAILLGVLFVGITYVAEAFGIVPTEGKTVIADVASQVYGNGSLGFYLFQAFTALILILAANTSYNAFPRLAALLAEDRLVPRHFAFRGDRLAYTVGILLLSGVAIGLIVAVQRRHPRADPALLGRRVRELHPQPVGHGPSLAAPAIGGMALAVRHQCRRSGPHGGRVGRRPGREGPAVAPGRGHHPRPRGDHAVHRAPVPPQRGGLGGGGERPLQRAASTGTCRDPDPGAEPGGDPGGPVRSVARG